MAGIFKAYDIRGIYGIDLTEAIAEDIGRAFVTLTGAGEVVVGRDCRSHSPLLFEALARGLSMQGCDVVDIGECSTPMSYFANGKLGADGSLMITASHNTFEWNGFKICRAQAVPISGDTGIGEIEDIVNNRSFAAAPERPGKISRYDIGPEYAAHVADFKHTDTPIKIAADMANGMGIWEARALEGLIEMDALYDVPDGTFPNHEANPLKLETLDDVRNMVRQGEYDFGISFDGDADRVGFVDEKGEIVPMDLITALIAQDILSSTKGVVFYDLRSSRVVPEVIAAAGGTPMMSRVGHAFIKQQMRDNDSVFAGELSGHYYFRDNYSTESSAMAVLSVANIVGNSGRTLSELVKPLRKYFQSGEINSVVERGQQEVLDDIRRRYDDGELTELDGISIAYDDWWFNVRCSNTEPLVRLNLEARTEELMIAKRDEILAAIRA